MRNFQGYFSRTF